MYIGVYSLDDINVYKGIGGEICILVWWRNRKVYIVELLYKEYK